MDGGLFSELVLHGQAEMLALTDPDLRARHLGVVGPDGGLRVRAADEVRMAGFRDQTILGGRAGPRAPRQY
jgi:hypothetical protein